VIEYLPSKYKGGFNTQYCQEQNKTNGSSPVSSDKGQNKYPCFELLGRQRLGGWRPAWGKLERPLSQQINWMWWCMPVPICVGDTGGRIRV
jgi:hypothetical protein